MFAIVEWVDWEPPSCSVVPSNWLISENDKLCCCWSPTPADEVVIKKRCAPNLTWPKYPVRILGRAGEYCYSYDTVSCKFLLL